MNQQRRTKRESTGVPAAEPKKRWGWKEYGIAALLLFLFAMYNRISRLEESISRLQGNTSQDRSDSLAREDQGRRQQEYDAANARANAASLRNQHERTRQTNEAAERSNRLGR